MAMNVAEARTEIKSMYEQADAIEKKYPEGEITDGQDLAEVKRLLTEIDGLEAKLATLEETEGRRTRISERIDELSKPVERAWNHALQRQEVEEGKRYTPGRQFTMDRQYLDLKNNHRFESPLNRFDFAVQLKEGTSLLEWKTLLTGASATSGGPFVANDLRASVVDLYQRDMTFLPLIPRLQTTSDTVEYVEQSTFTNAAAFTAEATGDASTGTYGKKPESTLAYKTTTAAVKTIAHWLPVTNRMLADAAQIRGYIDSQLLLGLDLALETQVISGDGSGENLTGIMNAAINAVGKGSDSAQDALWKGRTLVRVTGLGRPSAIVLHPNDFSDIRLARENAATGTLGGYLMGPPAMGAPVTLWGLPVVESIGATEGTGLVGDWAQAGAIFDREQSAIRVGTINDQFIRNIQTILAEARLAWALFRPKLISQVTGI